MLYGFEVGCVGGVVSRGVLLMLVVGGEVREGVVVVVWMA
jgi:hypothetical protein